MLLKRLFLWLTVLTTRNVAASDCIDGAKYEYNIKYNCSADGKYLKAIGCVPGKNQDGGMINFGSNYTDTDYTFLCAEVDEKFAYLPKFCVFREVTPSDPTILSGGETKLLAPAQQAVCETIEHGGVRKQIKKLEYDCDWAGGHYKHEQGFTLANVNNGHQSGAQFQCMKGKVVQIACRSRSTEQLVLLNSLETSKDGSALLMCKKSADEREGVALYTLQPVKIMVGKCKQGAKTYNVKEEWDDADGNHWYRCDYNAKQNKAFITKGCVGYSKSTRPRYFKNPEKLKKLRINANEYFKLSRKSTYLCAPDGSFVDVFSLGCKDAKGNTKRHGKKYVIGTTTVFKCSEKMLRKDDGGYYVKPNWYLYGCAYKKPGGRKNRYYRTDSLRESVAVNGAKQMYACHKKEGKAETVWLPLVSAVYNRKIGLGSNRDTTTTIPVATPTIPRCAELEVTNGKNIVAGTLNGTTVTITCDSGLYSYYQSAKCINGQFRPSRAVCGAFPPPNINVVRYQGQFLKVFGNPSKRRNTAVDVCSAQGGVLATALSQHLLRTIRPIIPQVIKGGNGQSIIGLRKNTSQAAANAGWMWIDSGTGATIDTANGNTVSVFWLNRRPTGIAGHGYGLLFHYKHQYGCNNGAFAARYLGRVLCQIAYPWYEFSIMIAGSRMVSPQESAITGVNLKKCTSACLQSPFCRSFSFSVMLHDCRHHSIPPNDPEAVIVNDATFTIYA